MNNIIYDDEIITPKNNIHTYYRKFIKKLNARDCVRFALFCAKTVNSNSIESNRCIELVEKWLLDKNSVNIEELNNVAYVTAMTASNATYVSAYAAWVVYAVYYACSTSSDSNLWADNVVYYAANAIYYLAHTDVNIEDSTIYLKTLLRTTKQYNTTNHNNQHYEFILKEIIKEDIDKVTDTDYNMLIDLSQEYYNINPNITNKRIFIELLRREYE